MRLCAKSIYCPQCRTLVKGIEHRDEAELHRTNVLCSRCGTLLHSGNGATWRYVKSA